MTAAHSIQLDEIRQSLDQRVILHNVTWEQYETILAARSDNAGVRITYLEGTLELMSPSRDHEWIKTVLARLIEAYADEKGIDLNGCGSWTVRAALRKRGIEPDECYILGQKNVPVPDLAIEVIWTSGGLDKLEIYRGLGVSEVWIWQDEQLGVSILQDGVYTQTEHSKLFPSLDLKVFIRFVSMGRENQSAAVRAFRAAMQGSVNS